MDHAEQFTKQERERLLAEKAELDTKFNELQARRASLQRSLTALEAYAAALKGPTAKAGTERRQSKRTLILDLLKAAPHSRADLITALSIKGEKSKEQALSNTLAALKKAGKITADGGKYALSA